MATFFDAIREGQYRRITDAIRGAEFNRAVDNETRQQAAARLDAGRNEVLGLAQRYSNRGSQELKDFAAGTTTKFNSRILKEIDDLAGDEFNTVSFLNDTLFSAAATGNNRTALAGLGLDFDKQEAIVDLMSRTPEGVVQAPITVNGEKFSEGGQQQGLTTGQLDRMLNAYQTNLLPGTAIENLSRGFALSDPNTSAPGTGFAKPALVTKLQEDPNYELTEAEEKELLNDPYVKELFGDQNIDSVDDLGKPGTFNTFGQDSNTNRKNIEQSLQGSQEPVVEEGEGGKPIGNLGIVVSDQNPIRQKGYKKIFTTEKIAEKLGVSVEKAKEFEQLLYAKSIRNIGVNSFFREDPQDWLLENVDPSLLQSKSKLLKGYPDSPLGRVFATNALVKEIAGGPGKANLKFGSRKLTAEEQETNQTLKKEVPSSETVTSLLRSALQKAEATGEPGVANLQYLDRQARSNLYAATLLGMSPALKDDPNFWKSMNALLGTGYLPVQLDLFTESAKNKRVATEAYTNERQDLNNFRNAQVFKNSRKEASSYATKSPGELEDVILTQEFKDSFSLWASYLDTDADTLARVKAAQPITDRYLNAIVNGETKRGVAGFIQSFLRGEARTGPFDSSNVKVLMTVNTPEGGVVELKNDANSKKIAEALLSGVPGYSVELVKKVDAFGNQKGASLTGGQLGIFGDQVIPMLIGNAMIQGQKLAKK